jgi:two-component system response regulator TctD
VILQCGQLSFDTVLRQFFYDGSALSLTPREYAVLEVLISRPGQAVPKEKLFDQVFALDDDANVDAIEIYIHRLRKNWMRSVRGKSRLSPCAASAICWKRVHE